MTSEEDPRDFDCDCRTYEDPVERLCSWCRDRRLDWEREKEEERIMEEAADLESDVHERASNSFSYEFPRTKDGWRDFRKEIDGIIRKRAEGWQNGKGPPVDQQYGVIIDNLLNALDEERRFHLLQYQSNRSMLDRLRRLEEDLQKSYENAETLTKALDAARTDWKEALKVASEQSTRLVTLTIDRDDFREKSNVLSKECGRILKRCHILENYVDVLENSDTQLQKDRNNLSLSLEEVKKQVDALVKERDEARRMWCYGDEGWPFDRATALARARLRGWDCFKENTDD